MKIITELSNYHQTHEWIKFETFQADELLKFQNVFRTVKRWKYIWTDWNFSKPAHIKKNFKKRTKLTQNNSEVFGAIVAAHLQSLRASVAERKKHIQTFNGINKLQNKTLDFFHVFLACM